MITKTFSQTAFYPCGLEIPEKDIFKSKRNLGISLLGALTGTSSADVEINRTAVSIGLGCFSLIAVGNWEYNDKDDFDLIDEEEDWWLNSCVCFSVLKSWLSDQVVAGPVDLLFNISPHLLLQEDIEGIQLFGPWRYLKMLHGENEWLKKFPPDPISVSNYLEFNIEPRNAVLCPNMEAFSIFCEEKDPAKKFRILLNIITTFASELSVRMQYIGKVRMSMVYSSGADVRRIFDRVAKAKLQPPWKPNVRAVNAYMKQSGMKKSSIDKEVRKILWPRECRHA